MDRDDRPVFVAIDPGTTQSAIVVFRSPQDICFAQTAENEEIEGHLRSYGPDRGYDHLAIEMVASYGMAVGEEVFETCLWIGRFIAAFNGPHTKIKRHEIKMHLCHTVKGVNDSAIRQRLIDLYGGKAKAIGKKKTPGPLYGFKADLWSALAVAYVWHEKFYSKEKL